MRRILAILTLAGAAALAGCEDGVAPPTDPVRAFVAAADLPRPQPVEEVLRAPALDLSLFRVRWGAPLACRGACYYPSAVGLRYGERVGWLRGEAEDGPASLHPPFDFAAGDAPLYQPATFALLRGAEPWLFHYAWLPALAADSDLPEEALLAVARELLLSVNLDAASALLRNPATARHPAVLRRLGTLPDAYASVRVEAARLLRGPRTP
ncbi:MAG TPA: hypothetical protein VMK65_09510 [Longimicrobiales bacterium]|nr:hypothetical protein [Longimicrobiales bacterium]